MERTTRTYWGKKSGVPGSKQRRQQGPASVFTTETEVLEDVLARVKQDELAFRCSICNLVRTW